MSVVLSPVSQLLCVFLHALILCELHELAGGSAHVDRRGSRRRQVAQRVPDEAHKVVAPNARPQLHRQAQAPHDGQGRSPAHLQGERSKRHRVRAKGTPGLLIKSLITRSLISHAGCTQR